MSRLDIVQLAWGISRERLAPNRWEQSQEGVVLGGKKFVEKQRRHDLKNYCDAEQSSGNNGNISANCIMFRRDTGHLPFRKRESITHCPLTKPAPISHFETFQHSLTGHACAAARRAKRPSNHTR